MVGQHNRANNFSENSNIMRLENNIVLKNVNKIQCYRWAIHVIFVMCIFGNGDRDLGNIVFGIKDYIKRASVAISVTRRSTLTCRLTLCLHSRSC